MADNLDRYVPEFDDEAMHERLSVFEKSDLLDMLVRAYKIQQVWAKLLDESDKKLGRIKEIVSERSALLGAPGVPDADDLRRMTGES